MGPCIKLFPPIDIPGYAWFFLVPTWSILLIASFKLRPALKAQGEGMPRMRLAAVAVWIGYAGWAVIVGYLIQRRIEPVISLATLYLTFIQPLICLSILQWMKTRQSPFNLAVRESARAYLIYLPVVLFFVFVTLPIS